MELILSLMFVCPFSFLFSYDSCMGFYSDTDMALGRLLSTIDGSLEGDMVLEMKRGVGVGVWGSRSE